MGMEARIGFSGNQLGCSSTRAYSSRFVCVGAKDWCRRGGIFHRGGTAAVRFLHTQPYVYRWRSVILSGDISENFVRHVTLLMKENT